jgi:hypothetical protein
MQTKFGQELLPHNNRRLIARSRVCEPGIPNPHLPFISPSSVPDSSALHTAGQTVTNGTLEDLSDGKM